MTRFDLPRPPDIDKRPDEAPDFVALAAPVIEKCRPIRKQNRQSPLYCSSDDCWHLLVERWGGKQAFSLVTVAVVAKENASASHRESVEKQLSLLKKLKGLASLFRDVGMRQEEQQRSPFDVVRDEPVSPTVDGVPYIFPCFRGEAGRYDREAGAAFRRLYQAYLVFLPFMKSALQKLEKQISLRVSDGGPSNDEERAGLAMARALSKSQVDGKDLFLIARFIELEPEPVERVADDEVLDVRTQVETAIEKWEARLKRERRKPARKSRGIQRKGTKQGRK